MVINDVRPLLGLRQIEFFSEKIDIPVIIDVDVYLVQYGIRRNQTGPGVKASTYFL